MKTDTDSAATLTAGTNTPRVIRIPIGARLKMQGGTFTVTSASNKALILTGPVMKLKVGEKIQIFGSIAQVTRREYKNARLQLITKAEFDTRPILQLAKEEQPEAETEPTTQPDDHDPKWEDETDSQSTTTLPMTTPDPTPATEPEAPTEATRAAIPAEINAPLANDDEDDTSP